LCNLLYPQAKDTDILQAPESAINGVFCTVDEKSSWLDGMDPKRLIILCRTNAPLIQGALSCLKQGKKAVIRGRDFSTALTSLIKHVNPKGNDDISTFLGALDLYIQLESNKALKREATLPQTLEDQADCLTVLADGVSTVKGVTDRIKAIFDDKSTDAIVFSTIHQAKGLESDWIAILKPNLMPGPWAKEDHELEEERHIQWVAWSRAKYGLIFVGGGPSTGLPKGVAYTDLATAIANDPLTSPQEGQGGEEASQAPEKPATAPKAEATPTPSEPIKAPSEALSKPKESVTLTIYSTRDVRGHDRDSGADAIRITRMGGGKAPTITRRAVGWQYHVINKTNTLIKETLPTAKLPALPTMKRGRNYDAATKDKWDVIIDAYRACGVDVEESQVRNGYEIVYKLTVRG